MITAETIIGNLVEFIVAKSLSAIATLSPNDRKKACRSLTKLYYSVQALEDASQSILESVRNFGTTDSGIAFSVMHSLNNHSRDIALASNMFIDLSQELYAGLKIIDPVLATCCDALYASKFDFLSEMSDTVAWDRGTNEGRIIIKMPKRSTNPDILNSKYVEASNALKNGQKFYWPDPWIDTDGPHQIILSWEDQDGAREFFHRFSEHVEKLTVGKQQLRELLRSSFNIEEVLFQADAHPYR